MIVATASYFISLTVREGETTDGLPGADVGGFTAIMSGADFMNMINSPKCTFTQSDFYIELLTN